MQLVAYGAQDIYLTGNPQITFFKVVYRRHTNFSVESIEQTFNGTVGFGNKVTVNVSRNGDLLSKCYLELTLKDNDGTKSLQELVARNAFKLIDYVEVEVGGQVIDKHYGDWMNIWCELTHTRDQRDMLTKMIDAGTGNVGGSTTTTEATVWLPLQFFFCRNYGLALPLIALQYHEVKFNVQFNTANHYLVAAPTASCCDVPELSGSMYCDYIFLDTDERRRFAQVSHEYLIEQLQFTGANSVGTSTSAKIDLNFNHPVKELIWVTQEDANAEPTGSNYKGKERFLYTSNITKAKLQLNGHDRFSERKGDYFRKVQRYQHHTGANRLGDMGLGTGTLEMNASSAYERDDADQGESDPSNIHIYSFALQPEEHQPSGTCNFSRIDNAVLNLTMSAHSAGQCRVYATNYNVLRIMSGMGGLAYSN